ncbi:amino acid adenylation domain-containing protein, partial [Trinickia sp.]|uniref:non-ribosomal peptide synthetase n=1 Tax=Trinickia sp. TaxID=2571163 RepID=UPI003F7F0655
RALFEAPTVALLARRVAAEPVSTVARPALLPLPRPAVVPLSFAQQRLWFLHRLDELRPSYVIPSCWRLRGKLDAQALEAALTDLIGRHESLRTTFPEAADGPCQCILDRDQVKPVLERHRLENTPLPETALENALRHAVRFRFDLASQIPLRATLFSLGANEHVLLILLHHIAADGESMGPLMADLAVAYASRCQGRAPNWAPLPIQYADYALWQRAMLGRPDDAASVAGRQLAYWRNALAGAPELCTLGQDRGRPAISHDCNAAVALHVPARLHEDLLAVGRRHGASLFMVLHAALAILLSRLGAGCDIVVGSPIAGRTHAGLEPLVGFFVNTLALRTDVSGNPDIATLLRQVRERCLTAYAHQDLPFDQVIEALNPTRTLSAHPLFQVMLALQNAGQQANLVLPELHAAHMAVPLPIVKCDLVFNLREALDERSAPDGLRGYLEYALDLFDPETIERLGRQWQHVLEAIVAAPDRRLLDIDLLDDKDRSQLQRWNDTARPIPALSVPARFEQQVSLQPDALAVVSGERRLTYAQLNVRANRLAHRLLALGVRSEDRIAVQLDDPLEFAVAILAVLKAGAAYAPLSSRYPDERKRWILDDAQATVLLIDGERPAGLSSASVRVLAVDDPILAQYPAENPARSIGADRLAYVIYTSGSTGRPKGVAVTHANIVSLASDRRWCDGKHERVLAHSPHAFDASTYELWVPLLTGQQVIAAPSGNLEPAMLRQAIDEAGVTAIFVTTAMFRLAMETDPHCLRGLRTLWTGGERASSAAFERMHACCPETEVVHVYGPTETTTFAIAHALPVRGSVADNVPLGVPLDNTQIHLLDARLKPVPIGTPGEICIGGAGVARGYLNRPALTAERFVADPFGPAGARLYRSGDLGRWRRDGTIEFLGRIDEQLKIRGFRIEPGEVQAALEQHPHVAQAAVIAREDQPGNRQLVAYAVAAEAEARPEPVALRRYLAERLPDYMVPAAIVMLDALPLSPNGKIDRKALPAPRFAAIDDDQIDDQAPRDEIETELARIWCELLKLERAGRSDHFFERGGHSLLAVRMAAAVQQAFGVEFAVRDLFVNPVLSDVADAVRHKARGDAPVIAKAERDAQLPMSFAQQRLWFLAQMEGASLAYHIGFGVQLRGSLDPAALRRALDRIVVRHEALRTTFALVDGAPVQRIAPASTAHLVLAETDLRLHPEPLAELERRVVAERDAPFDLEHGPAIRGRLIRQADDTHTLWITLHHIVFDGWSMGNFVGELSTLYNAFARGQDDPLPALALQYADYSIWQRRWMESGAAQRQAAYWKATLANVPSMLDLPTDRPRPARQSYAGALVHLSLDEALTIKLKALSGRHGTTLFMTLLSAWAVLLSRLSRKRDLVVGTPTANRGHAQIEPLIGCFVNMLALRIDLDGAPTVGQLLARVKACALAAQQHQDLPFEQVVELTAPARTLAYSPLCQTVFVWQNTPEQTLDMTGVSATPLRVGTHATGKFDLTLALHEDEGRISGGIEYATALFDAATVERFADYLRTLLQAMADDDARPIDRLPMVPAAERNRLLAAARMDANPAPEATLPQLFEQRAQAMPHAPAVVFEGERLTYAELNRHANRLAHELIAAGVGPGHFVAIALPRSLALPIALLGVLKSGAAYVPLDPDYPPVRLAFMLEDAKPALVVTNESIASRLPPDGARLLLDAADVRARLNRMPATNPADRHRPRPLSPSHPAYVIYTSGSTGRPKGVVVEHRNVVRLLRVTERRFRFDHTDVWTLFHSFAFDFSVWEIWGALAYGGKLVIVPALCAREPQAFYALLCREGVTVLNQTPSAFAQLIPEQARSSETHRLRYIVFGGEALELRTLLPWIQRTDPARTRLINMYGITEITVHASFCAIERRDIEGGAGSRIGAPLDDLQIYLLDESLEPVPAGVPGELYVGGAGVARGYLGRPALTAERFIANPFGPPGARLYKTGDVGKRLSDGTLEFLGRNDEQVKIRGFRIELGEIEAKLAAQDGVRDAVVLAREDEPGGKRLVAYLVAREGCALDAATLRDSLATQLADYMLPSAYVMLDALPLTVNGKLDRKALPEPDSHAYVRRGNEAPQGPIERAVARIWSEVLRRDSIGRHDDFFELGGHSLLAVSLLSRIRDTLQREVPLAVLFGHPNLADFVAEAVRCAPIVAAAIAPAERTAPLALSFAQQRLWFVTQMASASNAYHIPFGFRLTGMLDRVALAAALDKIVERHEALRTTFDQRGGQVFQVIAPPDAGFALRTLDLSAIAEPLERGARLHAHLREQAHTPFDLERGPLIRASLVRLAPHEHVLFFCAHHIVFDGWSNGVLTHELGVLYGACRQSRTREGGDDEHGPLPPLPIQYADYALWQRKGDGSERDQAQIAYWKHALAGIASIIDLPTDRPRPPRQDYAGSRCPVTLDVALTGRLRALSQRHGVTLYMTLMGAWAVVLSRLSGQRDVVIGSPTAGRTRSETEPLIGLFVNTLAVRYALTPGLTVAALLDYSKRQILAAQQHAQVPFEKVVEQLQPPRNLAHTPIFQVMLAWQNTPRNALALDDLAVSPIGGTGDAGAKFDLTLTLYEAHDQIVGSLEYATALYDRATIEQHIDHLRTLLEAVVEDDSQALASLPLLTPAQRQQVLSDWNATETPYPHDACLHRYFEAQAERTPDAVAVVDEASQLTYSQLNARANRLARRLIALGIRPHAKIALCVERDASMAIGMLGILKAGCAYVPMDPYHPASRHAALIEDCAPAALVTQRTLLPELTEHGGTQPVVVIDSPDSLAAAHEPHGDDRNIELGGLTSRALAYVLYTSGSTGAPKGVMIEHRSVMNLWQALEHNVYGGKREYRRVALNAAISFDASLQALVQLLSGRCLVMVPQAVRLDAAAMSAFLKSRRIDAFDCTPAQLELLIAEGFFDDPRDLPKAILVGGEAISVATWGALRVLSGRTRIYNVYGPTECTVDTTLCRLNEALEHPSIGRPLGNTRVYLLDAQLEPVPIGTPGEICIGGAGVARGYLNRPALTAERFVADPFGPAGARLYRSG